MSILAEDSGFIIPLKETYPITQQELADAERAFAEFDLKFKGTKTVVPPKAKPKKSSNASSIYNIDAGRMF